jgi:ComF family protein
MARLRKFLKARLNDGIDLLWPPVCPACDTSVQDAARLCVDCWEAMTFIGPPQCVCCGLPLPDAFDDETMCGECMRARPPFDQARSACVYDEASRAMILPFKHADRTDLLPAIMNLLQRPVGPLLVQADLVAPVPLHWTRLFSRRYNQAALISNRLGKQGKIPSVPDLVVRKKRTPSQGGKSKRGRQRNVKGAFRVPQRFRPAIRDKRVLLVDDVMTTGATVSEVSRVLLRAGAGNVDVITFARAVIQDL